MQLAPVIPGIIPGTNLSDAAATAPRATPARTPHRQTRVAIRAWGAMTAFGDLAQTWDALLAGRFITDHTRAPLGATRRRALELALSATHGVAPAVDRDAGLIVGTSKGAIENWIAPFADVSPTSEDDASRSPGPAGLGDVADGLAERLRLSGPRLTVSAACASGLHALVRGAMMIRSGQCRQVLVVSTEASLHPLFVGSFRRLGVLARPGDVTRPFDRARHGFLMSEAAAAVLLARETDDDALPSPGVFLDRFALGGDATHLTASDPATAVLRRLLTDVLDRRPVDLVHAHGTGTVQNDAAELLAIESAVAPGSRPLVYSHKAALGHSLGASGLLSVVLNCACHASGVVPPNPCTREPVGARSLTIHVEPTWRRIGRSIAMAAGFGGPAAVVSLASGASSA